VRTDAEVARIAVSDVRVFLSYDVDHDVDLGDRLCEQSSRGGWGFSLVARSASGEVTDRWCEAVRLRIRESDQVIVICGEHTAESLRVDEELRIAQEEQKPCLMLWGRRDHMCTMPARAKRNESMYRWTRETLLEQLSPRLRNAQATGSTPDAGKRP
jgi:hypothetical protein